MKNCRTFASIVLSALLLSGCFSPEIELTPKETESITVSDTCAVIESITETDVKQTEQVDSVSAETQNLYENSKTSDTNEQVDSTLTESFESQCETQIDNSPDVYTTNIPITVAEETFSPETQFYPESESVAEEYSPEYTDNYHGHVYTGGPYSKKYHYEANCAGKNSHEITWDEVESRGLGPCGTCVLK